MAVAAFVAGCASSSPISRIDANRALYESWPLEMQQAVLDGRAEPGMTREMVRMALGEPTEITGRSAGNNEDEIWIYRKGGDDGGMGLGSPSLGLGGNVGGLSVGTGGMGTSIGTNMGSGIGMGTNMGMGMPMPMGRPTPVEEREIVFQDGVVLRADPAP